MNLDYDSYHAFKNDGAYYLLDNEKLLSCVIDEHVYIALTQNNEKLLTEKYKEMFDMFHHENIFFVDEPKKHYTFPNCDMVIISMAIFHGCNLRCKYCFADAGDNFKGFVRKFTMESISRAITFLLTDPFFSRFHYYRINLVSGGEPLVDKSLFRTFIKTAFELFGKSKKHLYVWFSTNGTLLTEDDLAFVGKYNVGYGISIDGCKQDNDRLRQYPNGDGTYDAITSNIEKILRSNIVPKRYKELWGLMVYTKKNANLLANLEHLKHLGFSTVQMRFVRTNDTSLNIDENCECLVDFVKDIFSNAINGDDSILRLICNDNDYIGKIIKRIFTKTAYEVRCSAGSYIFSFAADGNIYPCDCFVGNPDFIIGNFYDKMYEEKLAVYKDVSVHVREKCKKCWATFICGGDCYHNSFLKHGNIYDPDDLYCKTIIQIIECTIAGVNQYRLKNRSDYDEFLNFLQIREKMSRK